MDQGQSAGVSRPTLKQRDLIALVAGAAAFRPYIGAAQSAVRVIGLLESGSSDPLAAAAFRAGLAETDFNEGGNVRIEYRSAEGHYDRLPGLAAELARIPVAVLATTGVTAALAAKKATTTVPVLFTTGGDAVQSGLVSSLNRPGGNVTGIVSLGKVLVPKQFELLHELAPEADPIGFLVNPKNGVLQIDVGNAQAAAHTQGVHLQIVKAGDDGEIEASFAALGERQIGALIVQPDPFLDGRHGRIAALAARYAVPAIAAYPQFAAAGGLITYGNSLTAAQHLEGIYAGRILKGEKPADLPVQQSVTIRMIINLKTAKALGLTVPQSILARADEVIE